MIRRIAPLGLTLILAACTVADPEPAIDDEIMGVWEMVTFTVDGEIVDVEEGVNTANTPYIVFEAAMSGGAGCNEFASIEATGLAYEDGILLPGEVFSTDAACDPNVLMKAEDALLTMLSSGLEITVEVDGETMGWEHFGATITWTSLDAIP